MRTLKAIWRGLGYVEGYGHHPGTGLMILFLAMGGLGGINQGWRGVVGGVVLMALGIGPIYLAGAYSRGKHTLD